MNTSVILLITFYGTYLISIYIVHVNIRYFSKSNVNKLLLTLTSWGPVSCQLTAEEEEAQRRGAEKLM